LQSKPWLSNSAHQDSVLTGGLAAASQAKMVSGASKCGVVSYPMAHTLKEDTSDAAKDTGMKKDNTDHGH
jgi:hypothetical protein